jgi:hypothetical protein
VFGIVRGEQLAPDEEVNLDAVQIMLLADHMVNLRAVKSHTSEKVLATRRHSDLDKPFYTEG